VVESSKSKTESDMAEVEAVAGACIVSVTCLAVMLDCVSVACACDCFTTCVSMSEEPCAGISHAGICAGDAG
jgi:hypothetical protein